ncbi:15912_t:CDS:2 [Dentiscutata erythropus]|uniref:15912_t:CDS:1 n=1 Tax=Dentiscutata erythropus TaxID=1348616 RepID=A0A9N8ZVI3_9GLOM|nr:15912_t:CDS:2 [Dentiscutata erythropus]
MRTVEPLPLKLRSQPLSPSMTSSPPMTPLSSTNASPTSNPTHQSPPEETYPTNTNDDIPVTHVPPQTTQVNPVNPVTRNIAPLGGMPYNNINNNIVPFMYKRSNNAYSVPYNIHKRRMIPNFGMLYHNPHLYRRSSPLIPIIGSEYHAQKTRRLIAKPGKKKIEPKPLAFEEDTLDLENADLFPIIETQSVSQTTNLPPGITQTFHEIYTHINERTQLSTQSYELPRHTRLNNLIYHTTTRAEAELLCGLVAQWRRKLLPITSIISRFLIKKLCEIDAHHLVFNMLADRTKYALKPNVEMFRWIMLAYANEVTKLVEDTTRIIKSEDKSEDKNEGKSDTELVLDDLYRTFGLMPYYDVPQFDVHLYTIMLSTSIKLESWQLVDEVAKELIDHLDEPHNRGKEIFGVYNDIEKYSDEIRISWLTSSLDVFIILEKWYGENNNLIYVEKFKNLQEQWKNEIKKVQETSF